MSLRIVQIDAFTSSPFSGNPAAVCILPSAADEQWMQNVAREMNLSETAFLYRQDDVFQLRWYTPSVEVDLCGHATLASAHLLWEEGHLPQDQPALFHTKSGELTAVRKGEWIELNFPALPEHETIPPEGMAEALGCALEYVGKNRLDYLVRAGSETTLRGLEPDFGQLRKLPVRGVMVTALSDSGPYDFVSRFFAPGAGIDEDPVTGSAHCCLGPYWKRILGKNEFFAYQASPRGGVVKVRVEDNRVLLAGQAVTVMRCELL